MKKLLMSALAACALLVVPAIAEAADGFATSNVNMRSGPSTRYPAVIVIPAGEPVQIYGCLADTPWCDVSYARVRGWVAGRYVQAIYRQKRVYVDPQYYEPLGIPTVVFDIDNYWDRNYRKRDFYRDRDRWRRDSVRRYERNDNDFDGWDRQRDDNRRDRNRRDRVEFYDGEDNGNNDRDRRRWDRQNDDNGFDNNRRDRQRSDENRAAEDAARAAQDAQRNEQRRQEVEQRRKQLQDADGNYNQGFDQDGPRTLRCKPGMEGCS